MKFFLPGQLSEWKQDRQISLVRGLLLGILLAVVACFIAFGWYLEVEMRRLSKAQAYELAAIRQKLMEQRDELGILHGLLTATFGKNTGIVIEQFKRKEGKK